MGIEYELKFRTDPQTICNIDRSVQGQAVTIAMETTYYDTPDSALSARHFTLRRRMENGVSVCTLKTPTTGGGRCEWEVQCARIEDAIGELCKLGGPANLPALVSTGLSAICGARFTRIAKTVQLPACTVELALDQGILTGGGRELALCEVEVELKDGSREDCDRYARILATKFRLEPETRSKFKRALALYKGE